MEVLAPAERDLVRAWLAGVQHGLGRIADPLAEPENAPRLATRAGCGDPGFWIETTCGSGRGFAFTIERQADGFAFRHFDAGRERSLFLRRLLAGPNVTFAPRREHGATDGPASPAGRESLAGRAGTAGASAAKEWLGETGALLPHLIGHDEALRSLEELLPRGAAEQLLLSAARKGATVLPLAAAGGRRLLEAALAGILPLTGPDLPALLGREGAARFVLRAISLAAEARRSREPRGLLLKKLRNAFRLRFDPTAAVSALVDLCECVVEEVELLLDHLAGWQAAAAAAPAPLPHTREAWFRKGDQTALRFRLTCRRSADQLGPVGAAIEEARRWMRSAGAEGAAPDRASSARLLHASAGLARMAHAFAGKQAEDHAEIVRLACSLRQLAGGLPAAGAAPGLDGAVRSLCLAAGELLERSIDGALAQVEELS